MGEQAPPSGPDLRAGIAESTVAPGQMIAGRVGDDAVLLAHVGNEWFATGATCTHYSGPLAEGLLMGDVVRCPWHHACFNLRTGHATCAPALSPLATYDVERSGGTVRVTAKHEHAVIEPPNDKPIAPQPESIVIVGAGAAGNAAAEMLRRRGYSGRITMITGERDLPYDRPNLSKDYLAGNAPEEWIPLRSREFYQEHRIELRLGSPVTGIDTDARTVRLLDKSTIGYDRLLLATGADPVRLPIATHTLKHVFTLRSLADSRAIIEAAKKAKRAVVVGASFIGLEVAAALRARDIEVHVVAPEQVPFERQFGADVGRFVKSLHESHGVRFHLGDTVSAIDATSVTLKTGARIEADLVVVGIGVRPAVAIAQWAKLDLREGVLVNEYLETSRSGIFAAGDIARWPDPHSGTSIRVEHWVVAERQGQTAARNMLGERVPYRDVPFFWSQHYDIAISYVGHHEQWDETKIDGSLDAHDCRIEYFRQGKRMAVATIGRDQESLQSELELARTFGGETIAVGASR